MIKPMHFAQTSIHVTNYFTYQLPVSAFGFRDDMVMEISVEHWRSVDQTHDLAHVWARQAKAHSKHLVYVVSVPVSERRMLLILVIVTLDIIMRMVRLKTDL